MELIYFIVSLLASVIGGICGIGGGVIIKPTLDLLGVADLATVGFLSSCTVLSMSAYNVGKSFADRSAVIDTRTGTPLALGAAVGGIFGNKLFAWLKAGIGNTAGVAQALCLLLLTLGTLIYTVKKKNIRTHSVDGIGAAVAIGVALGTLSSFLGIGGGPFNLVVLHFFFGMETKKAVSNSLYIILFSQAANLAVTILSRAVPAFAPLELILMILGGIGGGIIGKSVSRRLSGTTVDKLFIALQSVIILICVYNAAKFM